MHMTGIGTVKENCLITENQPSFFSKKESLYIYNFFLNLHRGSRAGENSINRPHSALRTSGTVTNRLGNGRRLIGRDSGCAEEESDLIWAVEECNDLGDELIGGARPKQEPAKLQADAR